LAAAGAAGAEACRSGCILRRSRRAARSGHDGGCACARHGRRALLDERSSCPLVTVVPSPSLTSLSVPAAGAGTSSTNLVGFEIDQILISGHAIAGLLLCHATSVA